MTSPNVVLVLADDLGWGDLGCYGGTAIPTPAVDRLARHGTRFVDCHAASAVCTPSRYGLVTGTYPWRSPLRSGVLGGPDPALIRPGQETLASALKAAGYATGAFGKWHLGLGWRRQDGTVASAYGEGWRPDLEADGWDIDYAAPFSGGPLELGFDRFFGIAGSLDMPPYVYLDQDRAEGLPTVAKDPLVTSQRPGPAVPGWRDDEVDLRFLAEASSWVGERVEEATPFFAYVATAAPHRPCVPPRQFVGRSQAGPRGDGVCVVDHVVGELVALLERLDVLDDTVVIVASDNGAPTMFPEDGDVVGHRPNGPWRGQKADVWEAGHRVPLIVSGPGVPQGQVSSETVSLLDLLPSLAPMTGATTPQVDGRRIASLTTLVERHQPRSLGATAFDGSLTVRHGSRKAIFSSGSGGFTPPLGTPVAPDAPDGQLYDLSADPAETTNLWPDNAAEAVSMYGSFCAETGYRR
ncbi:MAG TPA: arylsulfatase [Propionibacteriaceae bacterium]|nr:arylsulfatase [Propionibacteriaceae bacterium]